MSPGAPKPTFLVIGAGKAGTTTLHAMLGTLSSVFTSVPKEIQYFSHPENPDFPLEWYFDHFRGGQEFPHRGESSPTYSMFPTIRSVPDRIHAMNPDVRLLYMVREPVSRMVSAYAHNRRSGYETRPIETAITTDVAYQAPSMYALQLSEYLRRFSIDQIHVEDLRDLSENPRGVLDRVCDFLEVDPDGHPVDAQNPTPRLAVRPSYRPLLRRFRARGLANRRWQRALQRSPIGSRPLSRAETSIDDDLRGDLRRVFAHDIAALEELLGRSFAHWRAD